MQAVNRVEKQIAHALERCGASVARTGAGRWEFALANGKSISTTGRLSEDWLILDAAVCDGVAHPELWRLLQLNAVLDGTTKFVLMPDRRSIHLRADTVLVEEEGLDGGRPQGDPAAPFEVRIQQACAGLKSAFGKFKAPGSSVPELATESVRHVEGASRELRQRCADTGWQLTERAAGTLVVDLEAEGGFYQAVIEGWSAGAHLTAEIARWDALAEVSRDALGVMLLKAGAILRLIRPAVDEQANRIGARFEVRFASLPSVAELDRALGFLSAGCSMCGREAKAVQDEAVAREYLAVVERHINDRGTALEAMPAGAD